MKTIILCAGMVLLLSSCNTMEGMGTDIEHGGEHVRDAAHDTHDRMEQDDTDTDRAPDDDRNAY